MFVVTAVVDHGVYGSMTSGLPYNNLSQGGSKEYVSERCTDCTIAMRTSKNRCDGKSIRIPYVSGGGNSNG